MRRDLQIMRLAFEARARVEEDQQGALGVGVVNDVEDAVDPDAEAELLAELACERDLGRLARFDLAAWKLPEAREMAPRGPSGDEDATVFLENAGDDED